MKKILIITNPEDFHAVLVAEALNRKGAQALLWQTSDFPSQATETVLFRGREKTVHLTAAGLTGSEEDQPFHSVWVRRPEVLWGSPQVAEADRRFADLQCRIFREGLLSCLAPGVFWVNPLGSSARLRSKLYQHQVAVQVGLEMPDTAYTNDPGVIRNLLRKYGVLIYKSFYPSVWQEEGTSWGVFTTLLRGEEDLVADHLLQAVPGIYQEAVPKDYELRVTVIGNQVFAAKILSQKSRSGKIDWRLAWGEISMEPARLDPEVTRKCHALMERLGIVFGCLDFIVTPEGRHVFLEVNQMGQFAFVESYCGLPLIDAMSEMLLQGRPDFEWDEKAPKVRLPDLQDLAFSRMAELAGRHLARPSLTAP